MRAALAIAAKDLRQRLRDRTALMVGLVIPFALASILGLTLGDVSSGRTTFDIAFAELDHGRAASAFRSSVLAGLERRGLVRVHAADSRFQARDLAERNEVGAAIVILPGFTRSVQTGRRAQIEVFGSEDKPVTTLVARAIAQSYASTLDGARIAVIAMGGRDPRAVAERVARLPDPIALRDVGASERDLDAKTYYAAGMAVFFLFFSVQFGISTLLDEREGGTLARLLAAPIPRRAVVAGKALTSIVIGVASMTALALASALLLGAGWGAPAGVALLIVAGVLAATATMALVVAAARTREQAGYRQSIVALVLGMVGGSFFPVHQAGGVIQALSQVTPHQWFLRGLRDLSGGAPASAALGPAAAILAFALVTGALATLRARGLAAR